MYSDEALLGARVRRELWERLLPRVHRDRRPLVATAGPDLGDQAPITSGDHWGAPWATTWFRFAGEIPTSWTGHRVEALIDLGFNRAPPGFQCEGLVVRADDDGRLRPVHGLHPRRTTTPVDAIAGPVEVLVEAASNPSFPQFRPSDLGSPTPPKSPASATPAHDEPLYRFRRAELVLIDEDLEGLCFDIEVVDGLRTALPSADPRRPYLAGLLATALDRSDDVHRARAVLAPALEPAPAAPRQHRVVATGHAHIDTAWLWPLRETERKCIRTFASVLQLMDEDPEFRFVCSQAQQYQWIADREPELFERIRRRVADGRWIPVGGMWVESDMNLPSGESLVRQIVFGQRWFAEHFGVTCTEMWIPDVFGYPVGLPQVFAAGGMSRFVTQKLSWNKQNRFPHHTFWWEGVDGTRVLTHFPPVDTYNAEITADELMSSIDRFQDHGWSTTSLMPFGYGDGGGGPTREMTERRRRLARIDPHVAIDVGTPADFFRGVEREIASGAPIPVWRGELYFETHRGTLTSQLGTKTGNRRCERLLVEAELWEATVAAGGRVGAGTIPRPDIEAIWREVLTLQFHDILPGSSIRWVHEEAEAAYARIERQLEQWIAALLAAVTSSAPAGPWIANPADAPIDGVVCVAADPTVMSDDRSRQVLHDGSVAVPVSAPPLAVVPLAPVGVDDRVVVTDTTMANGQLAVRWGPDGWLSSVIDVAHARELLPVGARGAVLELAPDRPVEYDAWDLESWTRAAGRPVTGEVDITVLDEGPLVGRVAIRHLVGPSTFTVTYELRAGSTELIVGVDMDWRHDEHLLSMAFPLDVRADHATCDVQFGLVERPTHPSTSWDAAKFEVCAHRFVDVSEPSFGVAILNDGRFGHAVFDGAVRVSLARSAKYPDPAADIGHHHVRLALFPHGPGLDSVRAAASRFNAPPRLVPGGAGGPTTDVAPVPLIPPMPVSVRSEPGGDPGVGVAVVKLADDGSGDTVVRLHEALGDRRRITVAGAERITAAWRCDLLEEPTIGEEVGDGVVVLTLRPFELVTLRLRTGSRFDGRDRSG